MIWRLPAAQRQSAFDHALRSLFFGVAATSAAYSSSQQRFHSTPGEPLVGQVGTVSIGGYEGIPYRPLVRGGASETEGAHYAFRVDHQRHLEAVHPLGL